MEIWLSQAKNYNEKTNYYRVQKLLEKAESGNDITIGVIGGSMTAGANAEPMETNCYGPIKTWFESTLESMSISSISVSVLRIPYFRVYPCRRETITIQPRFNYNRICLQRPTRRYLSGFLRKHNASTGKSRVGSRYIANAIRKSRISKIERQYPIAQHCQIPIVSYNDAIKDEIIKGEKTWLDYYQTSTLIGGDGIHPNTTAHQKIADLIATELLEGKKASNIDRMASLPAPLYSNILKMHFI